MSRPVPVSRLNGYVKAKLEGDEKLRDLLVSGEISNFNRNQRSGHIYFVLKDTAAAVRAVLFRSYAASLRFAPENGMKVVVRCTVSLYERDGSYQLYVREMIPDGTGALYLAYEQLKARLAAEGLFDSAHKRPLPRFPRVVGIVTSPTGAAIQDLCNILGRRWPLCRVILAPATVQGEDAGNSVREGLRALEALDVCDVIIVGRGGGSIEDLWGFNDEALARAIYACKVPVISAVGHETDFTIADFVADLRAPTPSAAAELAVPDAREVLLYLDTADASLREGMQRRIRSARQALEIQTRRKEAASPRARIGQMRRQVDVCQERMERAWTHTLSARKNAVLSMARLAQSLSPLSILTRGYGVLFRDGHALRSVDDLPPGTRFTARLCDGEVGAVTETAVKYGGIGQDSTERGGH